MRYLFRGLIRESGKTVEGAVEAETPEDALNALSGNGIVTEDLTPAPIPIGGARLAATPRTAGRAGAPPLPPGELAPSNGHAPASSDFVPAELAQHPGSESSDPIDRAFAAASQSVSFDAVAQRYKGKSVWVIDRDKIRRQVAGVVDQALRQAQDEAKAVAGEAGDAEAGDRIRESVADALKELFKDNRNIASQQTPEQAEAARREAQAQQQPQVPVAAAAANVTSPQLESLVERMEKFLGKADTVLTQLQVAARRVGTGGGGGGAAGFGPRRMSHIPKPRNDAQNEVLLEIFKSNVKLRDNLNKKPDAPAEQPAEEPAAEAAPA